MNKEVLKQQILEALTKKLGNGFHISIQKVLKTNLELDGLTIMEDGKNITPTIYMEPFYEALNDGASIDDVINRILQTYSTANNQKAQIDISSLHNFDYVKDKLYVQLINKHLNQKLLQGIPHILFLDDFAVIVRCIVKSLPDCNANFLVTDNMLNTWNIDQEALMSLALQNTRDILGVELMSMNDFLKEMNFESQGSDCPIWIMSNKSRMSGAATVLFDDLLEDFAEKHGSFCVIFSSVHEILLIPTPDNSSIDEFTEMNREVNASQVRADEILGTKAYYYSKGSGFILQT